MDNLRDRCSFGVRVEFFKKVVATLARFQQGHEAMPDAKAATDQARHEAARERNREQEGEERFRERMEERSVPVPDADALHHEMIKRAEELAVATKRMEEERLNREAEARVKEKVAAILEEKKAA